MLETNAAYVLLFILNPLAVAVAVALSRKLTKGEIMSDVQAAVDEITAVLVKARDEIVAEIASLEESLNAGMRPDLSALKAVADSLDAIVPDAEQPAAEEALFQE